MKQFASSKIANILLFNLLWLALVIGRENLLWITGPVVLVYVFLLLRHTSLKPGQLALPALIGISVDSILRLTGLFEFQSTALPIPVWLMLLWVVFTTTLPLSLSFIAKHKAITVLAGATGFPFSYAMGERLGAVTFGAGYLEVLVFLSLFWAAGLPLLFYISQRLSGRPHAISKTLP
jgi:hypothetical protein